MLQAPHASGLLVQLFQAVLWPLLIRSCPLPAVAVQSELLLLRAYDNRADHVFYPPILSLLTSNADTEE